MGWVFTDEMRFYLHDGETLLDGMIRTGHQQVRFECRQGYCGACRMQIIGKTGQITYKNPPIAILAEHELLACCCMATGSLQVSYDKPDNQPTLFQPSLPNQTKS